MYKMNLLPAPVSPHQQMRNIQEDDGLDVARSEEGESAENLARWHLAHSTFGQGTVDQDGMKPKIKSFIENINK